MPVAVGIDLGTTFSAVAALVHGKVEVIANDFGQRTTPSCVAFVDGEAAELVGEAALRQAVRNPANTVYDVKRLIGRSWNEQSVQDDIKCWPFKVDNDGGLPAIRVVHNGVDKKLSPHEVSAMVLRKLKSVAEGLLGESVTEAVITVPAYFSDSQRRATREAGELAGLRVLRLVSEPTAAALAYALEQRFEAERTVLVYDLGGGTFDVSVVRIHGRRVDVQAVGGNAHLGGLDVDQLILNFAVDEIKRKLGHDVRDDAKRMRRLLGKCELAKRDLSVLTKAVINVMDVVGEDEEIFLHRARLEEMCRGLLNGTADTVRSTLEGARLTAADIDEVILVGGSTRMPCVERLLTRLFPGKPLCKSINPDESVAYGAALWAAFLAGNDAAFLEGLHVQSVVPLSIGVDSWEGEYCVFIARNTPIPVRKEIPYVTLYNNQSSLTLKVYQGERLVADRNKFIGKFVVEHIPPAPAGLKLDVALALDDDGILSVQAKLVGSIQWQGCVMRLDDVASTAVVSNLEDAKRFLREDQAEVQRIRARFALSTALRNERGEVPEKCQPKLHELQKWFDSRKRTASTRDFEDKLASFKKMKS